MTDRFRGSALGTLTDTLLLRDPHQGQDEGPSCTAEIVRKALGLPEATEVEVSFTTQGVQLRTHHSHPSGCYDVRLPCAVDPRKELSLALEAAVTAERLLARANDLFYEGSAQHSVVLRKAARTAMAEALIYLRALLQTSPLLQNVIDAKVREGL